MTKHNKHYFAQDGFSLVEMAIVLGIVALLMASLLPLLSGQVEQGRRAETRKLLNEIQQALVGYAIINNKLPCPTTTLDPANANYGFSDPAGCASPATEGYLPWKTLGVAETDAWGTPRTSSGDQWLGYWRYRVEPNFASGVFALTTTSSGTLDLQVRDSSNNRLTNAGTTNTPLAIVFSTGPNLQPDGENADYETASATYQSDTPNSSFDDITIWISRPVLFNRMVAAGKLP
jgi:prepilin-type N-terminal cleavage/methylation domain-containing protein